MTNSTTGPRCLGAALVSLLCLACTDDAQTDLGVDTTETGDGDATGDGDGDPGDGDKPDLGATPNVLCEAATVNFDLIIAENQSDNPDVLAIEAAYVDTGLQDFVQLAGAVTGRIEDGLLIDDAAILTSLANAVDNGTPLDMLDIEWRIYLVMQQYTRHQISAVAATLPDPNNDPAVLYAQWDDAWCYWNASLRPLAQLADEFGLPGDSIEADIDAGFAWGHDGIEGPEQAWAIDEWAVPPAKQVIEKTTYTMAHRLVVGWSTTAFMVSNQATGEKLTRSAYGAFQLIEDRMEGKNTPGIAIIESALQSFPLLIDPAQITREMNVTFAKRTRKYTDYALPDVGELMGTPEGHAGANEGSTYSKLIEPYMLELPGFDQDEYRAQWAAWIEAVANDDVAAGEAASAILTDYNCQLQAQLGIAECTSSIDEQ